MAKKITLAITIALLTFFLIVPFLSYRAYKSAIKEETFNHLITARDLLKLQIWNYFNNRYGDIDTLSRNPVIAQGFTRLSLAFHNSGYESSQFQKIAGLYHPLMEYYVSDYGYINIFFIDKEGNVLYSVMQEGFTGSNLFTEKFRQLAITQIFERALKAANFGDYTWNDEVNEYTAYFAAPVYEKTNLLGVIITEIPFSHLDTILTQRAGMGQTGEMYLVGEDGLMRSNSRFSVKPTILQKEVNTDATKEAFEGYVGAKVIEDYRGVPVLSAYTPLNLNFINWALLVEIDAAEAFAPIFEVESKLKITASIMSVIVIGYIYIIYRREKKYNISKAEEESEESESE